MRLRFADNTLVRAASLEILANRLPLIGLRELRVPRMSLQGLSAPCIHAMVAHLARLDLASTHIGNDGAKDLASALEAACSLSWLNVSGNEFTAIGMDALQAPLAKNKTLMYLNLSYNALLDCGAAISAILTANVTLRKLSLKGCKFRLYDWDCVARGLAANRGLRELVLYGNEADQDVSVTYGALAQALVSNQRLQVLKIQREDELTFFQDEWAAERMLTAVERNFAILNIQGCSDNKRLQAVLTRNRAAKERVVDACVLLLMARKFDKSLLSVFPTDIVRMIARLTHETRGEAVWAR